MDSTSHMTQGELSASTLTGLDEGIFDSADTMMATQPLYGGEACWTIPGTTYPQPMYPQIQPQQWFGQPTVPGPEPNYYQSQQAREHVRSRGFTIGEIVGQTAWPPSDMPSTPVQTRPVRMTKRPVQTQCYNCKKAHLSCDVDRPCNRCKQSGKQDTCYNVAHKRRGRPRLRDTFGNKIAGLSNEQQRSRLDASAGSVFNPSIASNDVTLRGNPGKMVDESFRSGLESGSPNYSDVPIAFLDLDLTIVRVNYALNKNLGFDCRDQNLEHFIYHSDKSRLQALRSELCQERDAHEPTYLPPLRMPGLREADFIPVVESSDIGAFINQGYQAKEVVFKFHTNMDWESRNVSLRLARADIYFVILIIGNIPESTFPMKRMQNVESYPMQKASNTYSDGFRMPISIYGSGVSPVNRQQSLMSTVAPASLSRTLGLISDFNQQPQSSVLQQHLKTQKAFSEARTAQPEEPPDLESILVKSEDEKMMWAEVTSQSGFEEEQLSSFTSPISSLDAVRNFFQDPESYQKRLQIIQIKILDSARLMSPVTKYNEDESAPEALVYQRDVDVELIDCLNAWQQIWTSVLSDIVLLQEKGVLAANYNIIVQDEQRPQIARVVPISLNMLESLGKTIRGISDCLSRDPVMKPGIEDENCHPFLQDELLRLRSIIAEFWDYLGFIRKSRITSTELRIAKVLDDFNDLTNVLFLGLASFTRSHAGHCIEDILGWAGSRVEIGSDSAKITFRKRRLACLDDFTSGPVLIFEDPYVVSTPVGSEEKEERLLLSTSLADFADTWGPAVLVSNQSIGKMEENQDRTKIEAIQVPGGILFRQIFAGSVHPAIRDDEILCHWIPWSQFERKILTEAKSFDISAQLVIGAPQAVCFQVNRSCNRSRLYLRSLNQFFLGTSENEWRTETRTFSFSVAHYIGGHLGLSQKLHPGIKLKDIILENWLIYLREYINYDPDPEYLKYATVLKISGCTGNATRITLDQFLGERDIVEYVSTSIVGNSEYWTLISRLGSFVEIWRYSIKHRNLLTRVIVRLLSLLRCTGFVNGSLQAWIPDGATGVSCKPSWLSMVKDRSGSATFAYVSSECWEFSGGSCCALRQRVSRDETLRTKILVAPKAQEDFARLFRRHQYAQAKGKERYRDPDGPSCQASFDHRTQRQNSTLEPNQSTVEKNSEQTLSQLFLDAVEAPQWQRMDHVPVDTRPYASRNQKLREFEARIVELSLDFKLKEAAAARTVCQQMPQEIFQEPPGLVAIASHEQYYANHLDAEQSNVVLHHVFQNTTLPFVNGKGCLELIGDYQSMPSSAESGRIFHGKWRSLGLGHQISNKLDDVERKVDGKILAYAPIKASEVQLPPRFHFREAMKQEISPQKFEALLEFCVT